MAQTTHSQENLKVKIAAVREVVPRCSNDDILLVLQHFDNDVDKTIQAFVEDGAADVLKEWNFTGKKPKNNKKKSKKRGGVAGGGQQKQPAEQPVSQQGQQLDTTQLKSEKTHTNVSSQQKTPEITHPKIDVSSGTARDENNKQDGKSDVLRSIEKPSSKQLPKKVQPDQPQKNETNKESRPQSRKSEPLTKAQVALSLPTHHGGSRSHSYGNRSRLSSENKDLSNRNRTVSESSQVSNPETRNKKKPIAILERPVKDLQRTTVPLTRYRNLLNEEFERSCKRIKKTFEEMHKHLEERENEMTKQMYDVKLQGNELLDDRQKKGGDLKMMCDRAHGMKESEIADLKAEIKHFVGERKVDEEIGKTLRFQWEDETLIKTIREFGEVAPIKSHHSQRRPSASSVTSSLISHDDLTPLPTPTSPTASFIPPDKKTDSEPESDKSPDITATAVAQLAAKLQKSLNFQQGLPSRDRPQSKRQQRPNQKSEGGDSNGRRGRNSRRRERYRQKMHNNQQQNGNDETNESVKQDANGGSRPNISPCPQESADRASGTSGSPQHSGQQSNQRRQYSPNKGQRIQRQGQWSDRGHPRTYYKRQRQNRENSDDDGEKRRQKSHQESGPRNAEQGKGDEINEHINIKATDGVTKMLQNEKQMDLNNKDLEKNVPPKDVPTQQMNGGIEVNGHIPDKDENKNDKITDERTNALPQRKPQQRAHRKKQTHDAVNSVDKTKTAHI
ncbi:spermatogenesis-associated serine-rich protein 2-like [Glandiceps talaboti]